MGDGLAREIEAEAEAGRLVERREHARVVRWIDGDEHVAKVLGRGSHQRGPADVDFLDERVEWRVGIRRGGGKRIQVDHNEIDEADAESPEARQIVFAVAAREDAAVNRRMQRLDAAVHHLGEAGERRDTDDVESRCGQHTRGAAGRHEFEPAGGEAAREFCNAGLVGNAQQGSWHITQSPV